MMKRAIANLPLHYGKAPSWLFEKMKRLSKAIVLVMLEDYDAKVLLDRLSDPFWFQSFGCLLGFDWHSSGLTTTVCGALKEGLKGLEKNTGIFIAGGKGAASRKTPAELEKACESLSLDPASFIYASKMVAKVDTSGLQDGFSLYHHTFFLSRDSSWMVIQQGMNPQLKLARRYHWCSEFFSDFVCEPHKAIVSEAKSNPLNMVAKDSKDSRNLVTTLAGEEPEKVLKDLKSIKSLDLPFHHPIFAEDIDEKRLKKILYKTREISPKHFEELLGINGVGPKTIRALALISHLLYGVSPSFKDPPLYSFAHGGKDGHPYPVNREGYERSIEILFKALSRMRLGERDRIDAIKRLKEWF